MKKLKYIKLSVFVLPILIVGFLVLMNSYSTSASDNRISDNNDKVSSDYDFENPFTNYIAFKKDPGSKIDKEEITAYWNEQLELNEPVEFTDYKIIFSDPGEYDKQYFKLGARSTDGTISVGTSLDIENDKFLLLGETCSCTTSECTNFGCEVRAGSGCSCSPCSGECTKKHTIEKE